MNKPSLPFTDAHLTRRAALASAAAGGLILTAGRLATQAQEATPPGNVDLPTVLSDYVAAFEAFDIERVIATLAEDVTYEEVPTGTVLNGHDAIRAHYQGYLENFADISARYTAIFASGEWAAGEWTFSARYTGALPDLPPGQGQEVVLRGVDVLEIAGEKIQQYREYYDFYAFLSQLGAFDAAEGATPTAQDA